MYINAIRELDEDLALPIVISHAKSINKDNYFDNKKITGYKLEYDDENIYLIIHFVPICVGCDCDCDGDTEFLSKINLKDLGLGLDWFTQYFKYRFDPRHALKRGDAIRIIIGETDDKVNGAFNAVVINYTPKMLSYITPSTHGPLMRNISAMECYHHDVKVYKYKNPDDYENFDPDDTKCEQLILTPTKTTFIAGELQAWK